MSADLVGWQAEPARRGSASIVISCIFTLVLCIWSVIHLNVPSKGIKRHLFTKLRWALIALALPERLIFNGTRERQSASGIAREVNEITAREVHPVYLAPRGLAFLAELGLLPGIPESAILEKSMSDQLGKGLAILQVSWFSLQCIGRVAVGMPLTLLEVHTIAHAIAAIALWVVWWEKPFDVAQPIIISGDWTWAMMKTMRAFSPQKVRKLEILGPANSITSYWKVPEIDHFVFLELDSSENTNDGEAVKKAEEEGVSALQSLSQGHFFDTRTGKIKIITTDSLLPGQIHKDLLMGVKPTSRFINFIRDPSKSNFSLNVSKLDHWKAIRSEIAKHPTIWNRFKVPYKAPDFHVPEGYSAYHYPLTDRAEPLVLKGVSLDKSSSFVRGTSAARVIFSVLSVAIPGIVTLLSGGVHLASWTYPFPTQGEQLTWRICSVYYLGVPILLAAILLFAGSFSRVRSRFTGVQWWWSKDVEAGGDFDEADACCDEGIGLFLGLSFLACIYAMAMGYVVMRVVLLGLALASLRAVPVGVYKVPVWTEYFPHF